MMKGIHGRDELESSFYLNEEFKLAILLSGLILCLGWLRGEGHIYPALGSMFFIACVGVIQRWAHLHRTLARPYLISTASKSLMLAAVTAFSNAIVSSDWLIWFIASSIAAIVAGFSGALRLYKDWDVIRDGWEHIGKLNVEQGRFSILQTATMDAKQLDLILIVWPLCVVIGISAANLLQQSSLWVAFLRVAIAAVSMVFGFLSGRIFAIDGKIRRIEKEIGRPFTTEFTYYAKDR